MTKGKRHDTSVSNRAVGGRANYNNAFLSGIYPATLIIFTIVVFYPGLMSPDSVQQYGQALSGKFEIWHPPIMSWIWSVLIKAVPGPFGMLLLHSVVFWIALDLVVLEFINERRHRLKAWVRPALLIGIGLFPPVFSILGVIWKDISFGCAFLMALALLFRSSRRGSRASFAGGVIFLFYGVSVRHNAVLALPPVMILIATALRKLSPRAGRVRVIAACTAIGAAILGANLVVSKCLAPVEMYPETQLFIYDLSGISLDTAELQLPEYMRRAMPKLTLEALQRRYTPSWFNSLLQPYAPVEGTGSVPGFTLLAENREQALELRSYWLHTVLRHWPSYLRHRLAVFSRLMAISAQPHYGFQGEMASNPYGIAWKPSHFSLLVLGRYYDLSKSLLFRGWIWLLLGTLMLAVVSFGFRNVLEQGEKTFLIALLGSGQAYGFSYFVAAIANDYRYIWWTVLSTVVAAGLILTKSRKLLA